VSIGARVRSFFRCVGIEGVPDSPIRVHRPQAHRPVSPLSRIQQVSQCEKWRPAWQLALRAWQRRWDADSIPMRRGLATLFSWCVPAH